MTLGDFETIDRRLRRLRSEMDSTVTSMGDTVTKGVDLEARRRTLEDGLRQFRGVGKQPRAPFHQRPSGIQNILEDVTQQVARFQPDVPKEAFLPSTSGGLAPPIPGIIPESSAVRQVHQELVSQGLTSEQADLVITQTRKGEEVPQALFEALAKQPGQAEQVLGKAVDISQVGTAAGLVQKGITKEFLPIPRGGISAGPALVGQVSAAAGGPEGLPAAGAPGVERASIQQAFLTSIVPPSLLEAIEELPAGSTLRREVEFLTSVGGLAFIMALPAIAAYSAVGGVALGGATEVAGAPTGVQIGAQVTGNILAPGGGIVPSLKLLPGGLKGAKATAYALRVKSEIEVAQSAAATLRKAGNVAAAEQLENTVKVMEGTLARAEGRALVAEPTGAVIGEGATPTAADITALMAIRAETIGDITAPEFVQTAARADVPATGETISSQVLQPRPQTGPAILQTQLPEGISDVGQRLAAETGGGRPLAAIGEAKDFFGRLIDPVLPQGGIPGGFKPTPKGMKPGAKVTGLTQEGEQVEGTLIQASGEKAIIRDAAGNVRPVTNPSLVEEAGAAGISTRLQDIVRDFRFGPSSRTAVPALDPSVQRFVNVLKTAKPLQKGLKAERAVELGKRATKGRIPFEAEAKTPQEALAGLRAAQKGPLPAAAEFDVRLPSGEKGIVADAFTQEEVTNFINIARFSPTLDRELFTRGNIIESLIGSLDKKGILFGRLPTPGELKQLERVYGAEFARELGKLRPFGERFWRLTLDALNIPRSLLAAFDLSFPFRQGVFAFARHPKEFFGNLPAMLRAAKNPEFGEQMVAAIKNDRTLIETAEGFRPFNELAEEAKLFLPDISGTPAFEERAEEFLSTLAHRIPGVGFSERGFIAYGDKLRSDIFRNTLQSWARQKPATAEEIADLGTLLNVLTGRGNLPPQLAKSLSFGFFAPRFAASRPQLFLAGTVNNLPGARQVAGVVLGAPGQTTRVARLATQELVTSVGAGLGILALVKMSGVGDVELDPRSSDFGKIKIGKTRIDFWGGARPWATMIARMITGKSRSVTGEFSVSRLSTLGRFGRSKLAPPAALTVDVIAGETAVGEEIGTKGDILRRALPLAIQDVADAVIQEGLTTGLLSTAAFLGVGFQTYETPGEKKKAAFEEAFPDRTYQATPDDNRIVQGAIEEGNNKEALEDAFQPSPEQMETEEKRVAQATELGLFTLAQGVDALRGLSIEEVLASRSSAGPEFAEVWTDYLDRVSGAIFEATFGKDKRGSPEYLAWRAIKLRRDPETSKPLWDEFFAEKDAAFAKLDPRLQRALELVSTPGDDPVLQRAVEDFNAARDKRREFFDLPHWIGIDEERSRRLEEIQRLAEEKNTLLAAQGSPDVPSEVLYELVGLDIGDAARARQAWMVRPGSKTGDELRNPERDRLLVKNTDVLFRFFPELYREELLTITGELERLAAR